MATILTFDAGANFTFRLKKADVSEPTRPWFNTYEMSAQAGGTLSDLTTALSFLLQFEVALHYNVVEFVEGTISTWEPDSHPYDPLSFYSTAYSGFRGSKAPTGDVEPREVCWWVSRSPQTGNLGKLFYRRALQESEVSSAAGDITLTSPATKANELAAAVSSSGLTPYLNGSAIVQLSMVSRNPLGTWVRPLMSIDSHGAAVVKFNHKWFNNPRGASVVPPVGSWSTDVHVADVGDIPRLIEFEE